MFYGYGGTVFFPHPLVLVGDSIYKHINLVVRLQWCLDCCPGSIAHAKSFFLVQKMDRRC